jgi:hypothetical protein
MYERFMLTLNWYVLNHAYPKGSMIEAYTTEEAINCCTKYIQDGNAIGLPILCTKAEPQGWGARGGKYAPMLRMKWCKLITTLLIS